jgi:hypothetical protein
VLVLAVGCSREAANSGEIPTVYGDNQASGPREAPTTDTFVEGLDRIGPSPVQFDEAADAFGIGGVQANKRMPPECLFNPVTEGPPGCLAERMTGGVTTGDYNGDGQVDLYLTRLDGIDSLYRNNGDGTFTDVTVEAGLQETALRTNGAGFADLDNDGHADLVVTTIAEDRYLLFINNGNGTFSEQGEPRGVALVDEELRGGTSVAFGDYDNDGWIDIHLTEWIAPTSHVAPTRSHARLLRNRGTQAPGYFDDVSVPSGVEVGKGVTDSTGISEVHDPVMFSFASAFADLDGDGYADLLVASDYGTTQMFWNNKDGTFTERTAEAGVGSEGNAMGLAIGDINRNGSLDVFISAIAGRAAICRGRPCPDNLTGNRLLINGGDRSFSEDQERADVTDGGWGWGAAMFDMDNDGHLDIVLNNGVDFELSEEYTGFHGPYRLGTKRLWHNRGDGTFTEVSLSAGINVDLPGTGLVVADLEGDGNLDFVLVHPHDKPTVWRNRGTNDNNWLRVDVRGAGPSAGGTNLDGLGAIVKVTTRPGDRPQVRHIGVNSHYLGHSEPTAHFGLGKDDQLNNGRVAEVTVSFPASGRTVTLPNVATNQTIQVREPAQ